MIVVGTGELCAYLGASPYTKGYSILRHLQKLSLISVPDDVILVAGQEGMPRPGDKAVFVGLENQKLNGWPCECGPWGQSLPTDRMLPEERMSPKEGTPPEVVPLEEGKLPKENTASKQQKPVQKNGPPPEGTTRERFLPEPETGTMQRANMSDEEEIQQEVPHEAVLRDNSTRPEECKTQEDGTEQKGSLSGHGSLFHEGMMHQEGTGQEESIPPESRMLCKGDYTMATIGKEPSCQGKERKEKWIWTVYSTPDAKDGMNKLENKRLLLVDTSKLAVLPTEMGRKAGTVPKKFLRPLGWTEQEDRLLRLAQRQVGDMLLDAGLTPGGDADIAFRELRKELENKRRYFDSMASSRAFAEIIGSMSYESHCKQFEDRRLKDHAFLRRLLGEPDRQIHDSVFAAPARVPKKARRIGVAPKAKTKCARPRRAKAVSRSKKECQKAKVIEDLAVESSWKSDSRHLGKAQAGGAGAAKARKRRATESVAVSTWCGFVCQMKRRIVRMRLWHKQPPPKGFSKKGAEFCGTGQIGRAHV